MSRRDSAPDNEAPVPSTADLPTQVPLPRQTFGGGPYVDVAAEAANEEIAANAASEDETLYVLDPETMDSTMHYRFVRNDPKRIAVMMANKGYRVVNRQEDGVRLRHEDIVGLSPDATEIVVGDMILMCCPKDLYSQRRARLAKHNEERLDGAKSRFDMEVKRAAQQARTFTITTGGPTS